MDSSSNTSIIDLTLSSSDVEMSSPKSVKSPNTKKAKIGGHGLEEYYNDFKEYTAGDLKGKTSAICTICKETVWHLKHPHQSRLSKDTLAKLTFVKCNLDLLS